MLILTRKDGESIMIGNNIKITLTESHKGTARIGIEAPRNIDVHRLEIFHKVNNDN